jgi:hypothetical protein
MFRSWFARILFCFGALTQLASPLGAVGRLSAPGMDAAHCLFMQEAQIEEGLADEPAVAAVSAENTQHTPRSDGPCHDHNCCSFCHNGTIWSALNPFVATYVAPRAVYAFHNYFVSAARLDSSPLNKSAPARAPPFPV